MPDILDTGISGLRAFQAALATTSHNVANVNTAGYSRQQVLISTRPPVGDHRLIFGTGAEVTDVRRVYDQFVTGRLRDSGGRHAEVDQLTGLSQRLDELLSAEGSGIGKPLDAFFNTIQDLSTDPASIPAREVVLAEARHLVGRFVSLDRAMDELRVETNDRLDQSAREVTDLAAELARINQELGNRPSANSANDLLDRRDLLLSRMTEEVGINVVEQDGAMTNVFLNSGEALVVGTRAFGLATESDPLDPGARRLLHLGPHGAAPVSSQLRGGTVSGLSRFRHEVLDPAQNALGRLALATAQVFNDQHQTGMDLRGDQGAALFTMASPEVVSHPENSGGAAVQVSLLDPGALQPADYRLRFDGGSYSLQRLDSGTVVNLVGSGPFTIDGMEIQIDASGGPMQAGDSFLLRPVRNGAGDMDLLAEDPRALAMAAPVRTASVAGNLGNAMIAAAQVTDAADPNLQHTVELRFADPPSSYDIVDLTSGATLATGQAYVEGADILVNGVSTRITGSPAGGDRFRVEANLGGIGDNGNALAMAALMDQATLDAGSASLRDGADRLLSQVGARARSAQTNLEAQTAQMTHLQNLRDGISGVNLEEEAADLLRFQQAYQAAAQLIRVSDELFQSVLAAVAR